MAPLHFFIYKGLLSLNICCSPHDLRGTKKERSSFITLLPVYAQEKFKHSFCMVYDYN